MDDFISREAVILKFCDDCMDKEWCKRNGESCSGIKNINAVPAADVRPVVRCRDCVYYNTTGCADGFGWCEGVMVSKGTSDDFFCAEGKQKPYECGAEMERNLDTTKGDNHD